DGLVPPAVSPSVTPTAAPSTTTAPITAVVTGRQTSARSIRGEFCRCTRRRTFSHSSGGLSIIDSVSGSPPVPPPPPLPPSLAPPSLVARPSLLSPGGAPPLQLAHISVSVSGA